jgi:hypothetical protein
MANNRNFDKKVIKYIGNLSKKSGDINDTI